MKNIISLILTTVLLLSCGQNLKSSHHKDGTVKAKEIPWISLFDGKSMDGWKVSENEESVRIEDGNIVVNGPRAHLYYIGEVENHNFKNFEFKAEVMTFPEANSGIYFHTTFQEEGWPEKGYEVQVNNSHTDWRRTGSLYGILDTKETYVKDNEWYTEYIKVEGKHVIVKINETVVIDYTEPEMPEREEGSQRLVSNGTFALQAHDPGSKVMFKNIMVRALP
jgi:hypothetical protein